MSQQDEINRIIEQVSADIPVEAAKQSIGNIYSHLKGYVQRGLKALEKDTAALLRQRSDLGSFVSAENAATVVSASFTDNPYKPRHVSDIRVAINIRDADLAIPVYPADISLEDLLQAQITRTVTEAVNREVMNLQDEMIDEGGEELTETEMFLEKIRRITEYSGSRPEVDAAQQAIINTIDREGLRDRGYDVAVNLITSILNSIAISYQYTENTRDARKLVVREYEETDPAVLPDERFEIVLEYHDAQDLERWREQYRQREPDCPVDPHRVEPGFLLTLNITTIKSRQSTARALGSVLNEFIHGISRHHSPGADFPGGDLDLQEL